MSKKSPPLRGIAVVPRCSYCEEPKETNCVRCKRPLCRDHRPPTRAARCTDCEEEHQHRLEQLVVPNPKGTLLEAARITGASFVLGGGAFGMIALLFALVGVAGGSLALGNALLAILVVFLFSGVCSAALAALLATPVVGFSGARKLRSTIHRGVERRRFLKERPGKRRRLLASPLSIETGGPGSNDKDGTDDDNDSEPDDRDRAG